MKYAIALFGRIAGSTPEVEDRFGARLRNMTSPAVSGPRLRRVMPPVLFGFRSRGHA